MATIPTDNRMPSRGRDRGNESHARIRRSQGARQHIARARRSAAPAIEFWLKINNDWIFNLAAILAYNLLMSLIPVLLLLLAIAGFFLGDITPQGAQELQRSLAHVLPESTGVTFVQAVAQHLRQSAPIFLLIGVTTSLVTGSRLFIGMENCFGIIFRVRGRNVVRQNVMAVGMLMLYIVLVPLLFLASILPAALIRAADPGGHSSLRGFIVQAAGVGVSLVVAVALFGLVYVIVPNRHVHWNEVWKGTLVAAALLVLYETLFPIYVSNLLHPGNYGSVVGFLLVLLIFFFYLSFILLLGAEVISWADGQRRTMGDLAAIMHELQAHATILGAAGATAGEPHEDLQHHKGARVMRDWAAARRHERQDHRHDAPPHELTGKRE